MAIALNILTNGKLYKWGKIKSFLDFFFPLAKNGKFQFIRLESRTYVNSINGVTHREFYTFRAFVLFVLYEFLINPYKKLQYFFSINQIRYDLIALISLLSPKLTPFIIAAIAFDDSTPGSGTTNSLSFAHTTSGSNTQIEVATVTNTADNTDYVTGVVYNSVALTQDGTFQSQGLGGSEMYSKTAPSSGANNVVVSLSSSKEVYAVASTYSGVKQTGQPHVQNQNATDPNTSLTVSVTTTADNSVVVSMAGKKAGASETLSAGTGVTNSREVNMYVALGDSLKASAGSESHTWNLSGSTGIAINVIGLAPAPETGGLFLTQEI